MVRLRLLRCLLPASFISLFMGSLQPSTCSLGCLVIDWLHVIMPCCALYTMCPTTLNLNKRSGDCCWCWCWLLQQTNVNSQLDVVEEKPIQPLLLLLPIMHSWHKITDNIKLHIVILCSTRSKMETAARWLKATTTKRHSDGSMHTLHAAMCSSVGRVTLNIILFKSWIDFHPCAMLGAMLGTMLVCAAAYGWTNRLHVVVEQKNLGQHWLTIADNEVVECGSSYFAA